MKRVLIVGNQGYIGPVLTRHLRRAHPHWKLLGYDNGYFAHCLSSPFWPDVVLDAQFVGDARMMTKENLEGVDVVIYLAAVSNDPMGNAFEAPTQEINCDTAITIAKLAREAKVGAFVFASSCSVYGAAEGARSEASPVNPLTAYAKSKVQAERGFVELADDDFRVTCLRFATACGMSPRLRLDLVLNDFVASAIATGHIEILSDGSPWRPLIHVEDMALAIEWAILREGDPFVIVNAGKKSWNYQIKDLAAAVADCLPGTQVSLNPNGQPDKRSYAVDFSKFERIAPDYQPRVSIEEAVRGLADGLNAIGFKDPSFRQSTWIRLQVLRGHLEAHRMDSNLRWI